VTKRKLNEEPDPRELPEYVKQSRLDNAAALDFGDLRRQFDWLKFSLTPIVLLPDELMTALRAARGTNSKLKNEQSIWDYYDHPGNVNYQKQADEFNSDLELSGLPALANGTPLDESAWAAIVARGIERQRISTSFLEAWAQLRVLAWRHGVIMAAQEDLRKKFEKAIADVAKQATMPQHVWYARWVLHNAPNFNKDRSEADGRFGTMCRALASGKRSSPNPARWSKEWFGKLLREERSTSGRQSRVLRERLSRMSKNQLLKLAEEKIPYDLLPPLTLA